MHPNLSRDLNTAVDALTGNAGIDIKALQSGTMFEAKTRNHRFTIVVIDPEKWEVAMTSDHPQLTDPDIWYCVGASVGGSMLKVGWVVVGSRMRMRRLSGGLLETTPLESLVVKNNPDEAARITAAAESRRPRAMTPEEGAEHERQLSGVVESDIAELPSVSREWAREMIGRFPNTDAKIVVLSFLGQAKKYDKLEQAIRILNRDFEEDWQYQHPAVRGDPEFAPQNAMRWSAAYAELEVPLPSQSG